MDHNLDPSSTHLFETLRHLVHGWLFSIHSTMAAIKHCLLHAPYPAFPLPHSFPFGTFQIKENFRWLEINEQTQTQILRAFLVQLTFSGLVDNWRPLVWSLFSGRYSFGRVFLDARLYHDPPPMERLILDAHFIVRCILAALTHHQDVRISSRIQRDSRNAPHTTWYETFEARTSNGTLLEEFGRRDILEPPRSCVHNGCRKLVPNSGPPLCMEHLQT